MSALENKVRKLLRSKYIYFSQAEITLIREQFRWYVEDRGGNLNQYKNLCVELRDLFEPERRNGGDTYRRRIEEVCKSEIQGYFAYMFEVHEELFKNCDTGYWVSNVGLADALGRRLNDAKSYLRDQKKKKS